MYADQKATSGNLSTYILKEYFAVLKLTHSLGWRPVSCRDHCLPTTRIAILTIVPRFLYRFWSSNSDP